jgi:hypothetical protein
MYMHARKNEACRTEARQPLPAGLTSFPALALWGGFSNRPGPERRFEKNAPQRHGYDSTSFVTPTPA